MQLNKRNTIFLILLGLAFYTKAQDRQPLSVSFEATPLRDVLFYLTQHQPQQFSYSKEQIPWDAKITLQKEGSLHEILVLICAQAGLEYEEIGGQIALRRKTPPPPLVREQRALAQVFGTVLDSASGKPLPFANVFFDNTSFGCTTDSVGKFTLNGIPIESNRLVVSYVGYRTLLTVLNLKADGKIQLLIRLQSMARQLADVVVVGKRDSQWLEDFELFKTEILGRTANGQLCTIQNPNVVRLKRSNNTLYASTSEPLEIDNRALGYHEKILIEKFVSSGDSCSYVFYSQFANLQPIDQREQFRWELNRLNAYTGSQIHLFRSILQHRVEEEGFEIFEWKGSQIQASYNSRVGAISYNGEYVAVPKFLQMEMDSIPKPDKTSASISVLPPGKYLVRYKLSLTPGMTDPENHYPTSIIRVRNKSMFVNANGTPLLYDNYVQTGYFEAQRLADKLPNDYDEVKSKTKVSEYERERVGQIEAVVIDSITRIPMSNVSVFINQSSIHAPSDAHGRVFFKDIPLGSQSVVFYKAGFRMVHRALRSSPFNTCDTIKLTKIHFRDLEGIDRDTREMYMAEFQKALFNVAFDGRRINNLEVVNITGAQEDTVSLWSLSPLEIIDKRLGYKVNVFIDRGLLVHEGTKIKPVIYSYCYFEDLHTNPEDTNIEAKRMAQYDGSFLNFSRSLLDGRTAEEGFALYTIDDAEVSVHGQKKKNRFQIKSMNAEHIAVLKDSTGISVQIPSVMEIHFTQPNAGKTRITKLAAGQNRILMTDFGIPHPGYGWQVKGHMEEKGLLPKLPINFKPFRGILLNPF